MDNTRAWGRPDRRRPASLSITAAAALAASLLATAPVAVAAPGPTPTPTPSDASRAGAPPLAGRAARHTGIAGVVVNSAGHRIPHLRLDLAAHPVRGRTVHFRARTDRHGRFHLAAPAKKLTTVRWTASGRFRWYGGTWLRELNTVRNRSSRLKFRADVTSRGADSLASGVLVRPSDFDGCTELGANPAYVASDPDTDSVTLTFTPVGRLVDGTTTSPRKVTLPTYDLCGLDQVELPAGAWQVTGWTDDGWWLAFAPDETGTHPYVRPLTVFNHPMPNGDSVQYVDTHFATS